MRAALAFTFGMFATGACGGSIATTGTNASQQALAPDSGVDGAQGTTIVAGTLGGRSFSGRGAFAEFISSPPFPGTGWRGGTGLENGACVGLGPFSR